MRAKICLVMILILSMILSASFAGEETIVSGRVNAELIADRALEQKYGITLFLQEYFARVVEETDRARDEALRSLYTPCTSCGLIVRKLDIQALVTMLLLFNSVANNSTFGRGDDRGLVFNQ